MPNNDIFKKMFFKTSYTCFLRLRSTLAAIGYTLSRLWDVMLLTFIVTLVCAYKFSFSFYNLFLCMTFTKHPFRETILGFRHSWCLLISQHLHRTQFGCCIYLRSPYEFDCSSDEAYDREFPKYRERHDVTRSSYDCWELAKHRKGTVFQKPALHIFLPFVPHASDGFFAFRARVCNFSIV